MSEAIPKTNYNTFYQIKPTFQIKTQILLNNLKTHMTSYGWTTDNFRLYEVLKHEMRERCKEEYNKNWEKQINNVIKDSKDTKKFWQQVNKLRGKTIPQNNYLKDENGREYHTCKEKCLIMQNTWSNIFRITEEEEQKFDIEHSQHTDTYINDNNERIKHHETIDFNRLNENCHITKPITEDEVKININKLKNKAPGFTRRNKRIFEKLPKKSITVLTNIYNGCLTSAYFPSQFKKSNHQINS